MAGVPRAGDPEEPIGSELPEEREHEQELLDNLNLPGMTIDMQERRKEWLKVPREVRAAIRRLHHMIGHRPKAVMEQIVKTKGGSSVELKAVKHFYCEDCDAKFKKARTHPVAPPSMYCFNYAVILDVLEAKDYDKERYSFLSVVCDGTVFHQLGLVVVGGGQPSSRKCLTKFMTIWVRWAGFPVVLACDRGLHNRGEFAKGLNANGVYIRVAGVEAAEMIGRGERHGGIFKENLSAVVSAHKVSGKHQMKIASTIVQNNKNETVRKGGIAPAQWVLGKYPRGVARLLEDEELGQLGALSGALDSTTEFGLRASYRATSAKHFAKQDCSRRYMRAATRNAGPIPKEYQQGDMIMYQKEQGDERHHGPARILGFEGKVAWCLHGGTPVAASVTRMRPANASEILAYMSMSRDGQEAAIPRGAGEQAGFLDVSRIRPRQEHDDMPDAEPVQAAARRRRLTRLEPAAESEPAILLPSARITGAANAGTEDLSSARITGADDIDFANMESEEEPPPGSLTQIEETWNESSTGPAVTDPGRVLMRRLAERNSSAASSSRPNRDRSRSPTIGLTTLIAMYDDHEIRSSDVLVCAAGEFEVWRAFWAERVESPAVESWKNHSKKYKSARLEKRGKLINYAKALPDIKTLLNASREKEWQKWLKYNAAEVVSADRAKVMREEGAEEIGTQWIELDKNESVRNDSQHEEVPYLMKSRLVALGNHEKYEIRSDSPTCPNETILMVCSFAASRKLKIKSGDLENAYFIGMKLTRKLLLRQPKGGLPGLLYDDRLLAKVPIYGTRDAGRGFWKKLRSILTGVGLVENYILKATYSYAKDGLILCIMGTHVDDLLWANEPEIDWVFDAIRKQVTFGSETEGSCRWCGREITQLEDFTVKVTCKETTKKISPIPISASRAKQGTSEATPHEREQLESVNGSLSWVAKTARAGLLMAVSKVQQEKNKATVDTLKLCNRAVKFAKDDPDRGHTFLPNVLNWVDDIGFTVTDASHANELEESTGEPFRSQGAKLVGLATKELWDGNRAGIHIFMMNSTTIRRVCRATVQCETYALSLGVESLDTMRAAIVDMRGTLDRKHWERSASSQMRAVWLTDCDSAVKALQRPVLADITDKRLAIEMAGLRQNLWRVRGTDVGDPRLSDNRPSDEEATDKVRWIDTDVMIADPLTKIMSAEKLNEAMDSNTWDFEQPIESILKKRQKQKQRRKTPAAEDDTVEAAGECVADLVEPTGDVEESTSVTGEGPSTTAK